MELTPSKTRLNMLYIRTLLVKAKSTAMLGILIIAKLNAKF